MTDTSPQPGLRNNWHLLLKIAIVCALGLLLLVPLLMVHGTLRERQAREAEAVASITGPWGGTQQLAGPVLVVPYTFEAETEETAFVDGRRVVEKKTREQAGEAFFLPEQLEIKGDATTSERRRGIYTAHVYAADLAITGRFAAPDWKFLDGLRGLKPQWERARVGVAISDLRGARGALTLKWAGADVPLQPGARLDGFSHGVHAAVPLAAGQAVEFALPLALNGSGSLMVAPLARQTRVELRSPWPDPSFGGAYLPVRREVGPQGFAAAWEVSYYGRSFPQQWADDGAGARPGAGELQATAFGVTLAEPVNAYRMTERAVKYGVLFIALVFTAFFLFEAVGGARLHGLNYLLVGLALCLFFLALLALAEVVGFGAAYAVAATGATALVAGYARAVLRSGRRALAVGGLLGGVFGYLFFVLRMEDYALLAGTAALAAMLAAVMFATRRLGADGRVSDSSATEKEVRT